MKSVFAEVGKVWRSRVFLAVMFSLLGINLFCLWSTVYAKEYEPEAYRVAWQTVEKQPMGERLDYAQTRLESISEEMWAMDVYRTPESELYEDIVLELKAANGYSEYVKELERKKNIITESVLFREEDSFSTRSAEKAYREYTQALPPLIEEAPAKGVELAMLSITDVLAACAGIFACVVLFVREREQDMVRLQWTLKKGRLHHLCYKFGALFVCALSLTLLFYGCNYIFSGVCYGFGPLGRDIRMVESYANSLHGFSVGGWLLLNFALKVVMLYIVLLLCSVFCTVIQGTLGVVLSFTGVLLVEYIFYTQIPATSVYSPLRYVNLFALFQNGEWLLGYRHINILGQPVNHSICVVVMIGVVFFIGILGSCLGYLGYGKKMERRSLSWCFGKRWKHRIKTSVFLLELRKVFILQRLLPVVLLLGTIQTMFYVHTGIPGLTSEEYYYQSYMKRLEGEITEKTPEILSELHKEAVEARSTFAMNAYERVEERYAYLSEHGGCFVYDTGFAILTGEDENEKDAVLTIKVMLAVLLFSASVFCYDEQRKMTGLLHTTVKGEKQVPLCKYIICTIFSFVVCLAVYIPDFIQVTKQYSVTGYSYPAVSLPWLSEYGSMSIGGYLGCLYLLRIVTCPVVVLVIMLVAERWKSFVYTFFSCGVVLLCIPILTLLHDSWKMLAFPLYGIYGNPLLQGGGLCVVFYVAVIGGMVVLAWKGRRKVWS